MTSKHALDIAIASAASLFVVLLLAVFIGLKQREASVDLEASLSRLDQLAQGQKPEISRALSSKNMTALDLKLQLLKANNREIGLQTAILIGNNVVLDSGVDPRCLSISRSSSMGHLDDLIFQRRTISYGPNLSADAVFQSSIGKRGEGIINRVFIAFLGAIAAAFLSLFVVARLSIIRWVVNPLREIQTALINRDLTAPNGKAVLLQISESQTLNEIQSVRTGLQYFVSELAKATEERAIVERELQISRTRYEMALQVAHDIRTPVTALKMVAALDVGLNDDSKDLIAKAAQRINLVADNLLSEFRREQSKKRFSLNNALKDIIAECAAVNPSIDLLMKGLGGQKDFWLFGDEQAMKRVFSNLINNAVDAGATRIEISLGRSSIDKTEIEIVDNGAGVSESVLVQLGKSRISDGKLNGNGLGTYSANQVVRDHGGDLEFSSQVGEGTAVKIRLP